MIFDSLIKKINNLDNKKESIKIDERPILKHFIFILKELCKLNKPFNVKNQPGKKEIKMRSLNGNERFNILKILSDFLIYRDFWLILKHDPTRQNH